MPATDDQRRWAAAFTGLAIDETDPAPPAGANASLEGGTGQAAKVEKQIKSLMVLGAFQAAGFRDELAAIKADEAAGKGPAARAALTDLAARVKTAFDAARKPPEPSAEEKQARKAAAEKATAPVGHGTAADSALVVAQLEKLPKPLLDQLQKGGGSVKVCKGTVTDYLTDLKGQHPRDWPAGKTWDEVPGCQHGKEVVIATKGTGADDHVPLAGEGHGSANLVLHETAHGIDHSVSPSLSTGRLFNAARDADLSALPPYETQPNPGGQEETFAESCARYYANDPFSAEETPHLHKYWRDNPLPSPEKK